MLSFAQQSPIVKTSSESTKNKMSPPSKTGESTEISQFAKWLKQMDTEPTLTEELQVDESLTLEQLFTPEELEQIDQLLKPLLEKSIEELHELLGPDVLAVLLLPIIQDSGKLLDSTLTENAQTDVNRLKSLAGQPIQASNLERVTLPSQMIKTDQQFPPLVEMESEVNLDTQVKKLISDVTRLANEIHEKAMNAGLQTELNDVKKAIQNSVVNSAGQETLKALISHLKSFFNQPESQSTETMKELDNTKELEKLIQNLRNTPLLEEKQVQRAQSQPQSEINVERNKANDSILMNQRVSPALASPTDSVSTETSDPVMKSEEQRFIKQMQRIFHQGTLTQFKDGQVQFTLKLFPEHLGKLQIQMIQVGQKLTAQIVADSQGTRDLVERSLPQLRQALSQQQIVIDQIEVDDLNQQQQHQESNDSEQEKQNQDETESTDQVFNFSFRSMLEGLFTKE